MRNDIAGRMNITKYKNRIMTPVRAPAAGAAGAEKLMLLKTHN
jgi:hypothetical protein